MKTLFKLLTCCVLLCGFAELASAQDVIHLQGGKTVEGKVTEIGLYEVKYTRGTTGTGPVVTVRKSEVLRIQFEDGTVEVFEPDPMSVNPSPVAIEKDKAIKFGFFSPLRNKLEFGYEQVLKPGINIDGRAAFITSIFDNNDAFRSNPRGVYIAVGPKLWLRKDIVREGERYAHALSGGYFKVELAASFFRRDQDFYFYNQPNVTGVTVVNGHVAYQSAALNLIYGKQWILGGAVTLDLYGGAGYGVVNEKPSESSNVSYQEFGGEYTPDQYAFIWAGESVPLTLTGGLRIGIML